MDVIREFYEPLGVEARLTVTGANKSDTVRLNALSSFDLEWPQADPANQSISGAAKSQTGTNWHNAYQSSSIPMSGPAFVALSRTLPSFLANAWLALLQNPRQLERLREEPDWMPRSLSKSFCDMPVWPIYSLGARHQLSNWRGSADCPRGDRVMLKLASANRDPAQFTIIPNV